MAGIAGLREVEVASDGTYAALMLLRPYNTRLHSDIIRVDGGNTVSPYLVDPRNLHCTLVYSEGIKVPDDLAARNVDPSQVYWSYPQEFQAWTDHEGNKIIVLTLESSELQEVHEKWLDLGARHSFPDFNPHITLTKPLEGLTDQQVEHTASMFNNLELEDIPLGSEYFEDIEP